MEKAITITEKEAIAITEALEWRLDMITDTHPDRKTLLSFLEKLSGFHLREIESLLERHNQG